jgi:hypothetical protein
VKVRSVIKFMQLKKDIESFTDERLHEEMLFAARSEKEKTAITVAHLAQVIKRKLYLKRGFSSDFVYCRDYLNYSGPSASRRVAAARLSLDVPEVSEELFTGELSLCQAQALYQEFKVQKELEKELEKKLERGLKKGELSFSPSQGGVPQPDAQSSFENALLSEAKSKGQKNDQKNDQVQELSPPRPVLDQKRKKEVFRSVCGKTQSETYQILANTFENKKPAGVHEKRAMIRHLSEGRAKVELSLSKEDFNKMKRLLSLLSHSIPNQDAGKLISRLLDEGLDKHCPVRKQERVEKRRSASQEKAQAKAEAEAEAKAQAKIPVKTELSVPENQKSRDRKSEEISDEIKQFQLLGLRTQFHGGTEGGAKSEAEAKIQAEAESQAEAEIGAEAKSQTSPKAEVRNKAGLKSEIKSGNRLYQKFPHQKFPERKFSYERVTIRQETRRAVYIRDGGRCTFKDPETGRDCGSFYGLDIDHIQPVAMGGGNELSNLRLCCSRHNRNWRVLGEERIAILRSY